MGRRWVEAALLCNILSEDVCALKARVESKAGGLCALETGGGSYLEGLVQVDANLVAAGTHVCRGGAGFEE